jgi:hypothetical protein
MGGIHDVSSHFSWSHSVDVHMETISWVIDHTSTLVDRVVDKFVGWTID